MNQEYTVSDVNYSRSFPKSDGSGSLNVFSVSLTDPQGQKTLGVELYDDSQPQEGSQVFGSIGTTKRGNWKFTRASRQNAQSTAFPPETTQPLPQGNTSPQARQQGLSGGAMTPDRERKIVRQHSQAMAVGATRIAVECGIIQKPTSHEELLNIIFATTDRFDKDVFSEPDALPQDNSIEF